ncbi:MAG: cytochrome c biogenesis heme-transporting ATPase CcmA [Burkholderiales bacterium]
MLEAHDLAARRGTARLFAGLGLRVGAGTALVVTGANGRGKTTLLRMLAGFTLPDAGEIRLDGAAVAPFSPTLRSAVTFAGHALALKDEFTARENLASLVELAGAPATDAELDAALERVALASRRSLPARVLSQGQRRRIGLARLALSRRRVWILDEPVTALDTAGAALLADLVAGHLDRGGLAVAATHAPLGLPPDRTRSLSLD